MSAYDAWLTRTPEDEQDAADAREARRNADAQRRHDESQEPPPPVGARRVFADAVWDPVLKCAVPDTMGRIVYPEDYLYDPLRGRE